MPRKIFYIDKVYFYLTEKWYHVWKLQEGDQKESSKFVIVDGEMHLIKKWKGKVCVTTLV